MATALLAAPAPAVDVPPLRGRVNDRAGLISPGRAHALEEQLARFEAETRHQLAVLTIPSTGDEPIADFSVRVFEAWGLGQAGLDNGVLLVVASGDRAAWITTGYGLEGAIPDAVASRIVREHIIPRFREGRMEEGIEAGVRALMDAARGERIAEHPRSATPDRPGRRAGGDPLHVALFCGLLGSFLASPLRGRGARSLATLAAGAAGGALCYALVGTLPYAILALVLAMLLGLAGPRIGAGRGRSPGWSRIGFGGAGQLGGGFGGGFSGGGGLTGGGGAGGRW